MKRLELEQERALLAALAALGRDLKVPPVDPERERVLLAAFDARSARRRLRGRAPVWTASAAAGLIFAATLAWWQLVMGPRASGVPVVKPPAVSVGPDGRQVETLSPALPLEPVERSAATSRGDTTPDIGAQSFAPLDAAEFVAWPGATAWPPFESGELIRVELPFEGGVVHADVLVGQDGFARAVRLVQ